MRIVRPAQHDHGPIERSPQHFSSQPLPGGREAVLNRPGLGKRAPHRIEWPVEGPRQDQDRLDQPQNALPHGKLGGDDQLLQLDPKHVRQLLHIEAGVRLVVLSSRRALDDGGHKIFSTPPVANRALA